LTEQISSYPHRSSRRIGEETASIRWVCVAETLGNQQLYRLAQEFIARVSEQFFSLCVDEDDPTVTINHDHGVGGRLYGQPELLFGPLPLGNVDDGA
jgi:hypothetical protein